MRLNKIKSSASRQTGALLIESMVAIAVFSIALLSLSGLQISSSKNSLSSALRTESAIAVSEIIDRMRSNIEKQRSELGSGFDATQLASLASQFSVAYGTIPTGTSQAESDINAWLGRIGATSFRGVIPQAMIDCQTLNSLSASTGLTGTYNALDCVVGIRWNDTNAEDQYRNDAIGSEVESRPFELLFNVTL